MRSNTHGNLSAVQIFAYDKASYLMDVEKNVKRQFADYNDRDYIRFLMHENKYLSYQKVLFLFKINTNFIQIISVDKVFNKKIW